MYPYDKRCNWVISGRFTSRILLVFPPRSPASSGAVRPAPGADGSW